MTRATTLVMISVLSLFGLGVLMVFSASAVGGDPYGLLWRHLAYGGLGVASMLVASRFDYHRFAEPRVFRLIVLTALVLLVLVLIPGIGQRVMGAQRWISFGGFGFQPSEFAKFALVLLLAVKLGDNLPNIRSFFRGVVPPMIIAGVFAGLVVLEKDIGIPFVMMSVAMVLLVVAGANPWHLVVPCAGLVAAAVGLVLTAPHRVERLLAFRDPWAHRDDESFQLIQSLAAFAQGGLIGRGLGAGEQKLYYLPAAHTDFIYAVIGEELGLGGSLVVLALFATLAIAGLRIAANAPDTLGTLLASGLTMLIIVQALFILAVTTGLLPTKGLPLPFISYGGTALIMYLSMAGVLVSIGAQSMPAPAPRGFVPRLAPAKA